MVSNEVYVGSANGNVTRCKAVPRASAEKMWRADRVADMTGTPAQPSMNTGDSILEARPDPHVYLDPKELELLEIFFGFDTSQYVPSSFFSWRSVTNPWRSWNSADRAE